MPPLKNRLQNQVLLISSTLYNLPTPTSLGPNYISQKKCSHGLSAQSNQSPPSSPHTRVITTSLPLLMLSSLPLTTPWPEPLPILVNALRRLIANDWELWSQRGLRTSVARWPHQLHGSWCSHPESSQHLQGLSLKTKSEAFSTGSSI